MQRSPQIFRDRPPLFGGGPNRNSLSLWGSNLSKTFEEEKKVRQRRGPRRGEVVRGFGVHVRLSVFWGNPASPTTKHASRSLQRGLRAPPSPLFCREHETFLRGQRVGAAGKAFGPTRRPLDRSASSRQARRRGREGRGLVQPGGRADCWRAVIMEGCQMSGGDLVQWWFNAHHMSHGSGAHALQHPPP